MDEKLILELKACGMDYDGTLHRFLNKQDMLCRFLKKFLDDESYLQLIESVQEKDYGKAFQCAHTLKGVTANLGIESVREHVSEITELLRGKAPDEVDQQQLAEELELLKEKYVKVCAVIRNME